ncbi:class I SAM-dependent methyltransferase [Spirochaetia bacterium 38H-sp]|uniref:Class I SAM-dependent methyltransferase n=1 Tax=Rarispira pelagica TaxID=3141764 RepID=A0ABU9UAL1_9SPIR
MANLVVYAASYGKNIGTGHIARAVSIVDSLRMIGISAKILPVDISKKHSVFADSSVIEKFSCYYQVDSNLFLSHIPDDILFSVLDFRYYRRDVFDVLRKYSFLVGIDPDYKSSGYCDISFSAFPVLHKGRVNTFVNPLTKKSIGVLSSTGLSKNNRDKILLVTMGGQDPYLLTEWVQNNILSDKRLSDYRKIVVSGPSFDRKIKPTCGEEIITPRKDEFAKLLVDSDIVITSFGLTAYESAFCKAKTWLLCPSSYHKRLADIAGFPAFLPNKNAQDAFFSFFTGEDKEQSVYTVFSYPMVEDLLANFYSFLKMSRGCPSCSSVRRKLIERFSDRSFVTCVSCKTEYELVFDGHVKMYKKEYFFEEYKNQYGKTYIEDFDNIKKMGKARLSFISSVMGIEKQNSGLKLLDVGCAYGPFLSAAKDAGFIPYGLDVSDDAVRYVQDVLGFTAWKSDFSSSNGKSEWEKEKWDVLSMWYVIEHFKHLDIVLSKCHSLIREGGVLAFSTPNARGLSRIFSKKKFYKNSPKDHYILLHPSSAKKILYRYGFSVRRVRGTGIHPERIPFIGRLAGKNPLVMRVFSFFVTLLRLGDTFEVYAVRLPDKKRP